MDTKTLIIDISASKKFAEHLKTNGITQARIRHFLGISKGHLSFILSGDRPLTDTLRTKMNNYLGTNF